MVVRVEEEENEAIPRDFKEKEIYPFQPKVGVPERSKSRFVLSKGLILLLSVITIIHLFLQSPHVPLYLALLIILFLLRETAKRGVIANTGASRRLIDILEVIFCGILIFPTAVLYLSWELYGPSYEFVDSVIFFLFWVLTLVTICSLDTNPFWRCGKKQ